MDQMAMMHREVDALRGDIATYLDASIFMGRANQNDRFGRLTWQRVESWGAPDLHQTRDREVAVRSSSDGGSNIKETGPNHYASWSDCYAIGAHSRHNHGHDRLALMTHDHRAIVAIKSIFHRIKRPKILDELSPL